MKLRISNFGLRIGLALLLFPAIASAESSALILRGSAGSEDHAKKFDTWTERTRKIMVENFGFTPSRVIVLSDRQTAKPQIQAAFTQLKQQLQPLDSLFIFFIGHGSYDTDYKFNISLADMTAKEYSDLIATLNVGKTVIVNSTNSSGGSIDSLAGLNRIVITSTRSGQEGNDTVFYEHFLDALQNATVSDADKDKKVSIWEAFKYAVDDVERFYKDAGRLSTEHALISANGAEKITAAATEVPAMARITVFNVDKPIIVADAKLQALLNEKKELEQKIEFLRINRPSFAEADYEKQLEDLLVELAMKNQQIRTQEGTR